MEKVLVTGGMGYIGSHTVVELVAAGYKPVIVDNLSNSEPWILDRIEQICGERPAFYQGDCSDKAFLFDVFNKEGGIAAAIHFAAKKSVSESLQQPIEYYKNNVGGTLTLLEAMSEKGVAKLVFSSSATVYGEPKANPIAETAERQKPTSPYGETKSICEDIISDVVNSSALSAVSLRYFNPVGAHTSGSIGELPKGTPANLVPYLTQTAAGIRESLTIFGDDYDTSDGTCIRDFIHVVDLARAHIAALAHLADVEPQTYNVFNVGTGVGESVLSLVNKFQTVTGVSLPYTIGPRRAGDIVTCYAAVDKINRELGWQATHSLEEALADAWRWQQALGQTQS